MPGTKRQRLAPSREELRVIGVEATLSHMTGWVEGMRTRKAPYEDALVGHRAAACAHMVNESVRRKQMIQWDFEREDIKA